MRRYIKLFVIYFPVILVTCQVAVNLMYFFAYTAYIKSGFILNTLFGVNFLFAGFLVAFTYWFRFCAVSRYAAWAEALFAINYLIVQQDNLYNILFQVIVGSLSILLTFRFFVNRFPLCKVALLWSFISSAIEKGSWSAGIELWEQRTYQKIQRSHDHKS